ncbi:hypothetical protein BaRGS_00031024, partial [Batillaria attramentaria]
ALNRDNLHISQLISCSKGLVEVALSSQSLLSSSGSDNLSVDSGHDERTQGTNSPLVFDPNHFGSKPKSLDTTTTATMTPPMAASMGSRDGDSYGGHSSGELRPLSLVERLAKTHSIWLLTQMSRAGAVHLLKDRETGVFIVRKSSQAMSLALSVQNRMTDRANVDHYLIEATDYGMRLQGSAHYFHSIPTLIAHYSDNLDELPYRLTLPVAILQARSSRELASLAMLGQDFWLSPVSRKSRSPSPASGSLHKSCSEPINITRPCIKTTPDHGPAHTPPLNTAPSHSVADFSDFVTAQQLEQEQHQVFTEHFSAQMVTVSQRLTTQGEQQRVSPHNHKVAGPSGVAYGPHVLRLGGYDTPTSTESSGEEGGNTNAPHIQLLPAPPQSFVVSDASSQTDFSSLSRHKPKSKPNLYSMTPVELLNIPENSYFRSSLSDKMSDYEDIWRSSYYDTDSVRNGSVRGVAPSPYDISSTVTARSDFSRFFAFGSPRETSAPSQALVVALPEKKEEKSDEPSGQQVDLSAVVPARTKPSAKTSKPFGRLSRLKSSSESSLATVSSPVYAEPADAVVFRDRQSKASRGKTRRQSAPSVANRAIPTDANKQKASVSEFPKLATIPSPDAVDQPTNTPEKKFDFDSKPVRPAMPKKSVGMSRSQSMRTPQEVARLAQKKPGWQERFNRLKLGTKVLTRNQSPYASTSQKTHPPQVQTSLDDSLCVLEEDSAVNSSTIASPSLNKFPVYHHSKKANAVNRGSYFSESSTVQDIISCAMPELMVRPIQTQQLLQTGKPLSEYDNFNPYAPPSVGSSHGTIFCKPWEGGVVDTLIRSSASQLPPAMDLRERVLKWQEANQNFHQSQQLLQQTHRDRTPFTSLQATTLPRVTTPTSPAPTHILHNQSKVTNPSIANRHIPTTTTSSSNTSHNHISTNNNNRHIPAVRTGGGSGVVWLPGWDTSDNVQESDDEVLVNNLPHIDAALRQRMQPIGAPTCKFSSKDPGGKIREYIYKLSQDRGTTFGSTIENFIQCTVDSQDKNPHHVMRNVRQFMSGIKNYLVKHGEGQLEDLIERERSKLGTNEILNIDSLIETTLHVCVLRPLKHHIYRLFVEFHGRNNSLELMSRNIKYARTKTAEEIGIKAGIVPPQSSDMETIKHYLDKMQRAYSPLKKLENLLGATSAIYACVKLQGKQRVPSRGPASLGADDFLPLLIYVLVHCGLVSAEIEADYMWGLLHPSVLTGEGGYYLTTLSSAVLILKNFQDAHESKTASLEGHLPTLGEVQGFLKIAFPDELRDSIIWKTLPVRPNMTTKDVCAMIAHKFKITNPQDYGLILLCDGEESQLTDSQCPQIIKKDNLAAGKESFFAYKRLGANIAWPSSMKHS